MLARIFEFIKLILGFCLISFDVQLDPQLYCYSTVRLTNSVINSFCRIAFVHLKLSENMNNYNHRTMKMTYFCLSLRFTRLYNRSSV